MTLDFASAVDLAASLSLILALGYLYAQIRRVLRFPRIGQLFLGIAFGLAAVSQMYRPFEPVDGLIIDLRAIPIALAGAFLGWRAAVLAMVIAVAARIEIGGVGAVAGSMAIIIAGSSGILWNYRTAHMGRRGPLVLAGLAVLMSLHLLAAFALPDPFFTWYTTNAVLPILAMNLIAVPVAAMILENERVKHDTELHLRSSALYEPENGLLTPDAFHRECAVRACSYNDTSYSRVLAVRLRPHFWLDTWANARAKSHILRAMFLRLQQHDPSFEFAGSVNNNLLLVPLTQSQILDNPSLRTEMRRIITEEPYGFVCGTETRVETDMQLIEADEASTFLRRVERLSSRMLRGDPALATGPAIIPELIPDDDRSLADGDLAESAAARMLTDSMPGSLDKMFERADLMMRKGAMVPGPRQWRLRTKP